MGKKTTRLFHGQNEYETELFRQLTALEGHYSIDTVFRDFLQYGALTISNICDGAHYAERKATQKELLQKYQGEITLHGCFQTLLKAILCNQERGKLRDVLGSIFEAIGLSNERNGQFFTSEHISQFMAKVTIGDELKELQQKPYITVSDPCIGSGRMLLAFANEVQDLGYNYCAKMVGMAVDIDITCVYMSYIQLSAYGISAVVIHGNSLTVEEWSRWYTPAYVWGGWVFKQPMGITDEVSDADQNLRHFIINALEENKDEETELLSEVSGAAV